jgi:hypothetical protein
MGDLLPGERLLWTGSPARARVMPGDLLLPGLLLIAVALSLGSYRRGGSALLVSVAFGIALFIPAAIWALRLRPEAMRRTVYRVTDRRLLIETGTRRTWAAYLDQLAEPVVERRPDGTADLRVREKEEFSFAWLNNRQALPRMIMPGGRQPFPVLRSLPDADVARQAISTGRNQMLRGLLDVPADVPPVTGSPHTGFVPVAGERVLWVGNPGTAPWWFGGADVGFSVYAILIVLFGVVLGWALPAGAPTAALGTFALAGVLVFGYPAVGRIVIRRGRIKRSTYILTSHRLIADWAAGGRQAGVQSPLAQLLPPEVSDGLVLLSPAWPAPGGRRGSWSDLLWPAAPKDPPQLIGLPDPQAVARLICAAQLAERARTWSQRARGPVT